MTDILFNKPTGELKAEEWKSPSEKKSKGMSSTGGITVYYYGDERCSVFNTGNYNFQGPKITFSFPGSTVDFTYACSETDFSSSSKPNMKNPFNWKHPTDSRPQIKITPDNVLACRLASPRTVEVMMTQGLFRVSI